MKHSSKCVIVLVCMAALLCACAKQTKYEPLETPAAVETEKETEPQTEEVISLVTLPPQVYVKVPVNLLKKPGETELGAFEDRGKELDVIGYQGEDEEGNILYYEVSDGSDTGYVNSWYVCESPDEAKRPEIATPNEEGVIPEENLPPEGTDEYYLSINSVREDRFGGGTGGDPDYYARNKEFTANKEMPERVKALYLTGRVGGDSLNEFIDIAKNSGINAFVVNIADNTEIAYKSEVMKAFCPSAFDQAIYLPEEYAERINRIKDAGFYVIGRMTTFNDDYLAMDHPELTISDLEGNPKELSNGYWPSPYSRRVWQYKLDIAKEAVDWFHFDEIQFDYVRFPDRTQSAEKEGDVDYRNDNNESKNQAIQRFLMYVTDQLHEKGIYVGADVFGEVSGNFVGGYGQYWPAISNVVDVISGMPYPDHYAPTEDYLPWEHPYETISSFAEAAAERQKECPTPAKVRTWIQGYNSFREPYTEYYADFVGKEIQALYDAGLHDGWMIWNGAASLESYTKQSEIYDMEPDAS